MTKNRIGASLDRASDWLITNCYKGQYSPSDVISPFAVIRVQDDVFRNGSVNQTRFQVPHWRKISIYNQRSVSASVSEKGTHCSAIKRHFGKFTLTLERCFGMVWLPKKCCC